MKSGSKTSERKVDMMQEVHQVQEVSNHCTRKKIDNLEGWVSQMNRENNAFREDILELEKEVAKVSAKVPVSQGRRNRTRPWLFSSTVN